MMDTSAEGAGEGLGRERTAEGAGERLERERPQKEWEKEWKEKDRQREREKDRQKEQGKRLRGRRGEDSGWSGWSDGNG